MPNITTEIGNHQNSSHLYQEQKLKLLKLPKYLKHNHLLVVQPRKKTIAQQLTKARIIHFATHGLLEYGIPEESEVKDIPGAIALAPSGNDNG